MATAMLIWKESKPRVDAALAANEGRCIADLFAAVEKVLHEEILESLPVPPRDKGH